MATRSSGQWLLGYHTTFFYYIISVKTDLLMPLPCKYTGTARAKKAPLVRSSCKTSRRWADQRSTSAHTASHVTQTSWRPAEDMNNHNQGRPGTVFRTASLRPRTMEEGLKQDRRAWCASVRSTQLVMSTQLAPDECRRKYKKVRSHFWFIWKIIGQTNSTSVTKQLSDNVE